MNANRDRLVPVADDRRQREVGSHIIRGFASLPPQRYQLRIKRLSSELGVGVVLNGKP